MSIAGPRDAYVFHALSADGRVADARASRRPATVLVSILSRLGDGPGLGGLAGKGAGRSQ